MLFVVSLLIPSSALAATETEPNNGIHQANGPLVASTNYDGTISASNEDDWFIIYVSGQGPLNIAATNINDSSNCTPTARLLDGNGKSLNSVEPEENETKDLLYNTPGAGTYYVRVHESCADDQYRLNVTGPLTTGPTPGPAEPTTNGHNSLVTALGPLVGDKLYGGSIDASNEEDWFFFYVAGAGTFDIAFTNINDSSNCTPTVRLLDGNGNKETSLNSKEPEENEIAHLLYTAAGAAKFVIRVHESCPVDQY
ncbi:MAG: PPC domain-containing protein [Solirubrobacterales bacterium]